MPSLTCPREIRKVADRFKSSTDFPYHMLCELLGVMLLGCVTINETVRNSGWVHSVSTLDRGMHAFESNRFMRRLRSSVLNKYKSIMNPERFCFAVDDTTVERSGKRIYACGRHPRHRKNGVTRAQRVMVLFLVDRQRGVAFPLAFAMCLNKDCEGFQTNQDLCFDLVKQVIESGYPALVTVVDSGFDSMPLMKRFDDEKWTVVMECKSNRNVKKNPSPNAKWTKWKSALQKEMKISVKLAPTDHNKKCRKTKYIASRCVQLTGRSALVKAGAVYNKVSDSEFFAVYVSNDLQMRGADLWEYSRARWHVEEAFRTLKQSLNFLAVPCREKNPTMASICLPFALLASLHMEPEAWNGDPLDAAGHLVRKFRERAMWDAFEIMATGQKRMAIITLQVRRLTHKNRKKPTDPSADDIRRYFSHAS